MIKLVKSTFYNEAETKKKLLEFLEKAEILSMGVECAKFEEGFAKKQGRAFAVFVNSGSSANLALIQALLNLGMLKKGNTVGVSALTWATNVMPLIQLGLHPIVIDCRLDTLNVSLETLKDHSASVQAVFLTNVLGLSDNIVHIEEFCHENAMLLLEDNCESLGSKVDGKLLGNFGLASTFSFFVGHHLSTIEGGMICTDDEELADMLKMVRAHGWDRNLGEATKQALRKDYNIDEHYARYTFYDLAFNMRPTEIHGFLGNEQLQYWDQIAERREENFKQLHEVSKKNSDFLPLKYDHMDLVSNFAFPVICRDRDVFDTYYSRFKNNDVEIRPIIAGNISQQPFFKKYGGRSNDLENANFIHRNGFYFGNNPELTSHEVEFLSVLLT